MSFESRYKNLNDSQAAAVDQIEGPLMVVAGPGTGKTELLSMRAANILNKTDSLPQNILCLTFTESGASSMRNRLTDIIGADAYKVAIHTFHSFGTEIINRYNQYFYNGANFKPASDAHVYEILFSIFENLSYKSPLASLMNGEFTYLKDTIQVISELKRSGITSDELFTLLDDNERVIDSCEKQLGDIFAGRISKSTKDHLPTVALEVANLVMSKLPPGIMPLYETLALSLSHAVDAADETSSTKPITAWRNKWMEKNNEGAFVFKDRKRIEKLRAVGFIYHQYLSQMQEKQLYDFDDMVLEVVHALEVVDELRFNLQEQYLYIMVDEFQDTNLAQSRLLRSLTNNPASEGAPNIMVVGDDDQAIYSFQGAEISNILQFKDLYETTKLISLKDNYRSSDTILSHSRAVITLGSERLETYMPQLDKTLIPHSNTTDTFVKLHEFEHRSSEHMWIVQAIKQMIDSGVSPESITVLARRHHELVSLLPYFANEQIDVNYERRENVLESPIIKHLELLIQIVTSLAFARHDEANALLPELLAHDAWGIDPEELWTISLQSSKQRISWMEYLATTDGYKDLHTWLVTMAAECLITPLEQMIDTLIGTPRDDEPTFISPLYDHYFSSEELAFDPERYIAFVGALRLIRDKLREHAAGETLKLVDFLEYVSLQRSLGNTITNVVGRASENEHRVNLMTAHKSKGMEFDHVFVVGAIDSAWGANVRSRSRLISYPENLPIAPAGDSYDERLRLFYVAMTRARSTLSISYSLHAESDAITARASFLANETWQAETAPTQTTTERTKDVELAWYTPIANVSTQSAKELLASRLENYKLSATHFNAFLDVTRGGPQHFLIQNLLRFPQAMSANAAYGSAVHRTLQQAHNHLLATKKRRPIEDLLQDFEENLTQFPLSAKELEAYTKRGVDSLQVFFANEYDTFSDSERAELSFATQQSTIGAAKLTGSLDLVDIDETTKTMIVTDYKTGKPSESWKGRTDFEKIKLHKYRQQLLFYKLLVENSRDYTKYVVTEGCLQFVEPLQSGKTVALHLEIDQEELAVFAELVEAVYKRIVAFDLPDVSEYSQNLQGILDFEAALLND